RFNIPERPTDIITFVFYQADDGIRDRNVTGVQTCAPPISHAGIKVTVAIAVADVSTRLRGGGVFSAADLVCLGREDLVDKSLKHLAHQIRRGLSEQFV